MKTIIKKILPQSLLENLRRMKNVGNLYFNGYQDMNRYKYNSFDFSQHHNKRHRETDLIYFYHKIEKGLSLEKTRVGFGQKNIELLIKKLRSYTYDYGWDDTARVSLNVLKEYYTFNKQNGKEFKELSKIINMYEQEDTDAPLKTGGGTRSLSKANIEQTTAGFKNFALSRYSIRSFDSFNITNEVIEEAVKIAQKTPSVCNRQPWRVHVYEGNDIKKLLKHQNGNAGFGESANKLLLITSNLSDFRGSKERHQAYIDGGLFSMSLMYSLHSLNIGSCPLNLSLEHGDEKKLLNAVKLPTNEVAIMMMAIGYYPEEFKVADSPRRRVEEVIQFH